MSAEPAPVVSWFPRPVPAHARLRPVSLPDYLPARMLNEFVYCPRLFYYEWVEGVFAHSGDTTEGALRHESIKGRSGTLTPADEAESGETIHARSVTLSSDRLHLIAAIDLVEGSGSLVTPVDYKRGSPRDTDGGPAAWPADRAQVIAQGLILRDNGYTCTEAVLFYNTTKQRVRVPIDEDAECEVTQLIEQARSLAEAGRIPPPLDDSPKCPRCSLVPICLPDETACAMGLPPEDGRQLGLFEAPAEERPLVSSPDVRRLLPARDDTRPLYVSGYGLSVGKRDAQLQVRDKGGVVQEARLLDISAMNVIGAVSITSGAIEAMCGAEKPVAYFSSGHWFYGLTRGMDLKNVFLRRDQFARAADEDFCVRIASDIVSTKIRNQRTLLQRNHVEPTSQVLARMKDLARAAQTCASLESLLGIEGTAARLYFGQFAGMLKVEDGEGLPAFDFEHRNRRPPRDPVNALLSFAYALLVRDCTIVCHAVGFDPFMGFYHQPRFGRPALALDLMEGFRPLVADSAVLTAVNARMVGPGDFVSAGNSVALSPSGRKAFIRSYEQRMDTMVTHPLFGYRVSYRRVLEIQARLLARALTGELARYPGFETR